MSLRRWAREVSEGQTGGLPGRTELAVPTPQWTQSTLTTRRLCFPGHHGMEEVRGSSPLSSTAKVLVKGYLILRDPSVAYATEGHLWLAGADRSESAACNHHSLGVRRVNRCSHTSPFFFVRASSPVRRPPTEDIACYSIA